MEINRAKMSFKPFSIIMPLVLILVMFGKTPQKKYIRLHYNGDATKPYPMIVFHLAGFRNVEDDQFFIKKFEISENDYDNMRKIIETLDSEIGDTVLKHTFQFTFYCKNEAMTFETSYLARLRQCFNSIITSFDKNPTLQEMLNVNFKTIFHRLKWDEQIDVVGSEGR